MISLDGVWSEMESSLEYGGSRRIDVSYTHDAFCTLDGIGRRGLLVICPTSPDRVPLFDAMEVTLGARADGRTSISLVVTSKFLNEAFSGLCESLLNACHDIHASDLAREVIDYLVRSNSLLEYGDPKILGASALRGLLGELILLRQLLTLMPESAVVSSWMGPSKISQDFIFSDRYLEVKTITTAANSVTISSIEQLDPVSPLPITLAVVTLSPLQEDLEDGMSPNELVREIRDMLSESPTSRSEFDHRLVATGYFDRPFYDKIRFRLVTMRYYAVDGSFPRLRRAEVSAEIISASYEIRLGACDLFEIALEDSWN